MDYYGFYTGKIFDAYKYLGCQLTGDKAVFTVFAPAARRISLIGEFNNWTETPMNQIYNGQFWQAELDGIKDGMLYKYKIYKSDGSVMDHCDPYGYGMELRPQSASVVRDLHSYRFHDEKWMKKRTDCKNSPLNIYEMHLGSWRQNKEDENGWYTYAETADMLIPYLKEYGYNYVEVLPVSEHPSDESWGYQGTGYYSPTSRYGTMNDLKYFIDQCHQNEIGVILDFVPVHFAVDDYALSNFDGTQLYEYPNCDIGYSSWGSKNFNHSRGEVQSFLQSNANYWLAEYHFDGLRMDAINNIIYWQGEPQRGINVNATEFLKNMNRHIKQTYPSVILAAEDSSSYVGVTKKVEEGGLGFDYKWDMGWMNDTLEYFRTDPLYRGRDYHKLTFSMQYYYDEHFLLPLSHDEVVHGKATITQKMHGEYEDKFPQARALYLYMMAHPGKKLNFMGTELGMFREWDEKRELDWDILKFPLHDAFHHYMKELNTVYLEHPELSAMDFNRTGFKWLDCHQEEKVIYAFERTDGKEKVIAVFNFSGEDIAGYELPVGEETELTQKNRPTTVNGLSKGKETQKSLHLLIASDADRFGGTTSYKKGQCWEIKEGKAVLDLPAFSGKLLTIKSSVVKAQN
ncbi:MAG: 1,4-alpha-glucan branching protein GlgB [Faecalicatena sp.]|uniref:1,4-alpha-glucan branching protein GlgB n=1 Tax=Faecalicatena sp. TaxID=2005360 RepID=UPI0025879042|nr:1,4-alpha-glucan branching protein GlgB [Faecalicatena sp.]MCI6464221.1 1,4-alpha-glucan branching protein GlgB [Faecalicatena sp.]MDY5621188.1 1,4-alpha-glucan branching protein GlgB [Lachnospiraceae bacterium]